MKESKIRLIIQPMMRTGFRSWAQFGMFLSSFSFWSLVFGLTASAQAGVVIKIRAINPLETEAVAPIHYPLPPEVTPQDIVAKRIKFSGPSPALRGTRDEGQGTGDSVTPEADSAQEPSAAEPRAPQEADFKIKYDKKNGYYYVDHEVALGPRQIVTLEVEVKDVWNIPTERIEALRTEVDALPAQGGELNETAAALKGEIGKALDQIVQSQGQSTVAKVGVEQHIKAYGKNREMLQQAQMDAKMLQNLLKKAKGKKKDVRIEEGR